MTSEELVLYIEDDINMQILLSDILKYEGIGVIVDNGMNIAKILEENNVRMIFMDENLGAYRGSDLCSQIRTFPAYDHIPIVMISGIWNISTIAQNCGAQHFIRKPFDMYDVISTLSTHYVYNRPKNSC